MLLFIIKVLFCFILQFSACIAYFNFDIYSCFVSIGFPHKINQSLNQRLDCDFLFFSFTHLVTLKPTFR